MRLNRIDPLRQGLCLLLALLLAGGALLALLVPAHASQLLLWPWPALPPLHTRCLGVTQLALAAALWAGRRALDPVALRLPLAGVAAWALAALVLAWRLWSATQATAWLLLGLLAWRLMKSRGDEPAPAEHADGAALMLAIAAALLGAALLVLPAQAAPLWPWVLKPEHAWIYGPPLLSLAVMALLAALERRAYVRAPAWWAFAVLALGLLATSAWHHGVWRAAQLSSWVWFAVLAPLLLLALAKLQTMRLRRLLQRLHR
jgi:hypothetical protein